MAKIHEEVIVITLSKLVKESADPEVVATDDIVAALGSVEHKIKAAWGCC